MSLASIGIVFATLIIFGTFLLISSNINYIGEQIQKQQQIQVFIDENSSDEQAVKLGEKIKAIEYVEECIFETKEKALQKFKSQLGEERAQILEGLENDNPLRNSYIVKLKDIRYTEMTVDRISKIEGVVKVKNAQEVVDKLITVTNAVKISSLVLMVLLALIGIFIISNTIKITMFARRREINIMKFVGATDGFIRGPFIVEGMVIGLIGSLVALIFVVFAYNYATGYFYQNVGIFRIKSFSEIINMISLVFVVVGTFMGAVGSAFSIRKHLRV
jgi:cell division transport system permease protein